MSASHPTSAGEAEPRPALRLDSAWLRATSALASLAALGWAAFNLTAFRTMSYGGYPVFRDAGGSLRTMGLVLGIFVLPAVIVLTVRRHPLRWLRAAASVVLVALVLTEAWAGIEEARWRAVAPELAAAAEPVDPDAFDPFAELLGVSHATIYQQRWWPFRHHSLYYDPTTQEFGGHD